MNKNYYIAALPSLSPEFYKIIEKIQFLPCYPEIRLPFHCTLFFLGRISEEQKETVVSWLSDRKNLPDRFSALVNEVSSFANNEKANVYFLKLLSPDLNAFNKKLERKFQHIRKDTFSYIPHISIFFPKLDLTNEDKPALKDYFKNITELNFQGIYLGSEIDGVTNIEKYFPLSAL